MRLSMTFRGAFPGRNPLMLTSRAIFLKAASTARSNSSASTSTESLTLFPSRGSTVDLMRGASVPGPSGPPSTRNLVPVTGSGAVVAHLLWGQAVGGSNPPSPTHEHAGQRWLGVLRVPGCGNPVPVYFPDDSQDGVVWQPDVIPRAEHGALATGLTRLVDVGCGKIRTPQASQPHVVLGGGSGGWGEGDELEAGVLLVAHARRRRRRPPCPPSGPTRSAGRWRPRPS